MHLQILYRYDEDEEDGLYEDVQSQSDSENEGEDDILEMRLSSRRSSTSSQTEPPSFRNLTANSDMPRPQLRRTSTSKSGTSRSSQLSDKEHVTIAPIAPTILKTGGSGGNGDASAMFRNGVGAYVHGQGYGHGYGGRAGSGESEEVAPGVSGELVYQPPEGSIYSMRRDANGTGAEEAEQVWQHREAHAGPSFVQTTANALHFFSPPIVSSPGCDEGAEEDGFDYFQGPDLGEDYVQRTHHVARDRATGEDAELRSTELRVADAVVAAVVNGRQRELSPDYPPPSNPRIASLKSEIHYGSPSSEATPTQSGFTTPTHAIPTPSISPAHQYTHAHTHQLASPSSPESLTPSPHASGLLAPPDMSPGRGRPACPPSPVLGSGYVTSGSATSSAFSSGGSGSRSVSESRSESRGRSRTPGSSDPEQEQEQDRRRGRSRSRSSGGTGSPLGSVSPTSSRPGSVVSYGGGFGGAHSGREIRDGRGVRLYRKTSEDMIGRGERGRERARESERRVSESLSPPAKPAARGRSGETGNRHAQGPPPAAGSMYQAYTVNSFGKRKADASLGSAVTSLPNGRLPPPTLVVNGSDTAGIPVIMEEDEQRSGNPTPANSPVHEQRRAAVPDPPRGKPPPPPLPPPRPVTAPADKPLTNGTKPAASPGHARALSIPSQPLSAATNSTMPAHARTASFPAAVAGEVGGPPTLAGRAADIVSSARGLLGAIWSGAA